MNESFNVELVLRDMLEVLRRHNIPVETAVLNVSLLDAAFDEHIPQLKNYKAGNFHRPMNIEGLPVLFHAQRRYPFNEIVQVLEQKVRPLIEIFAATLQGEYSELNFVFINEPKTNSPDSSPSDELHFYRLGVECQFSDDVHIDYNRVDIKIILKQHEATAHPHLHMYIGWLVDEESGGDWGLDIVDQRMINGQLDFSPHQIDILLRSLPSYLNNFREEIVRKFSGEPFEFPHKR